MHHPNPVMESKSSESGRKVRSCNNEERQQAIEHNLSIMGKSEEVREHFFSKGLPVQALDVFFNLVFILIHAVKEIIVGIIDWIVLCPVAWMSSCRNCPAFKVCPGKKIIGDFKE
jgi:hypothetical protein